jgi:hypothetical protein
MKIRAEETDGLYVRLIREDGSEVKNATWFDPETKQYGWLDLAALTRDPTLTEFPEETHYDPGLRLIDIRTGKDYVVTPPLS